MQRCIDGSAFIHCAVAFGQLVEWEQQIEDFAAIGLCRPKALIQAGVFTFRIGFRN